MCNLPENKLFCCSTCLDWAEESYIVFIIDWKNDIQIIQQLVFTLDCNLNLPYKMKLSLWVDETSVLQTFPKGLISAGSCSIYHNNFVYVFTKYIIMGFDLLNKRWKTFIKSDKDYYWWVSIAFNHMILALEYDSTNIYVVDPLTLSISSQSLPFVNHSANVLFSFGNVAYLIDFGGKIFESGINDPFNWKFISYFTCLGCRYSLIYSAFYKDCWYFVAENNDLQIYQFDLNLKSVEKVNLPL